MKTMYFKCAVLLVLLFAGQQLFAQQCITFDMCDTTCNGTLVTNLKNLGLDKGDFFTVRIRGINPYRYNVRIATKDDTFKVGKEPAMFANFIDVGKFGEIAGTLLSFTPSVNIKKEDSIGSVSEEALKGFDFAKALGKPADKKPADFIVWDPEREKYAIATKILEAYMKAKRWKPLQQDEFRESVSEELRLANTKLQKRRELVSALQKIDSCYQEIKSCYDYSIIQIWNAQFDCNSKTTISCLDAGGCKCEKIAEKINDLLLRKRQLEAKLNDTTIASVLDKSLKQKIDAELASGRYSKNYLSEIYLKAYSNFKLAGNIELLSSYNSFPIQVKGDMLELKIDITPKDLPADPKKDDKKREEEETPSKDKAEEEPSKDKKKTTNTLTNQSPVTININAAPKSEEEEPSKKKEEEPDKEVTEDPKKEKEEPAKTSSNSIADTTFRIKLPPATLERHLSYKFRTGKTFYGYGGGFFVDWLHDDNYTNKPVDPNNASTQFTLVKERNESPNKYGIMASVNCGSYIGDKNAFVHIFVGPGFSMETKIQPRLLIGGGFGWGDTNKFSVNGGIALGQVKRLSGAFDTSGSYAAEQTNIYHTSLAAKAFVAIIYTFDIPSE